jgi:preprotein translocase subunit SecB
MTFEPQIQPSIRLDSFHLAKLDFNLNETHWEKDEITDTQFKINFTHLLDDERDNYFGVLFKIFIQNPDNSVILNFDFIGHFESFGVKINSETLNSEFFKFAAPAIIFPYIRSFVSNFTLNSGFKPIILPTINFQASKKVED